MNLNIRRPDESFVEYRTRLAIQNKHLAKRLKGRLLWSTGIPGVVRGKGTYARKYHGELV